MDHDENEENRDFAAFLMEPGGESVHGPNLIIFQLARKHYKFHLQMMLEPSWGRILEVLGALWRPLGRPLG